MRIPTFLLVAVLLSFSTAGTAQIVLDFRDPSPAGPSAGTAGETLETGAPFMVSGLAVTAMPTGTSLAGDGLLANADSFGVDSNNFPGFTDVADDIQFDGGETLSISFDQAVEVTEIDLQGLVGAEAARVSAGAFSIDLFTGVADFNGTTDVYDPAVPIEIPIGTPLVFEGTAAGGAFGLQGLTLNVVVIPEPASALLWSVVMMCAALFYWRRKTTLV